jgi:ABC-type bacteriocin/lantibiotic exporter with double-glycine peptidase domain
LCGVWSLWGKKAKLAPSGGLFFPLQIETMAPSFAQADARWGKDLLGPTDRSLAAEGCAVTSAAMALGHYGIQTDPQQLNRFLTDNGGFTEQGWIYWEAAAEFEPGKIRHAYEDLPSYRLMDWNLLLKNPVIVRIRRPGGGTHFVLVVGKVGYEYIALDPGAGGRRVFLSELESPVEALRFYRRL